MFEIYDRSPRIFRTLHRDTALEVTEVAWVHLWSLSILLREPFAENFAQEAKTEWLKLQRMISLAVTEK